MKIIRTKFKGLLVIKNHSFKDVRGYFREMYLKKYFNKKIFSKDVFPFWCVSKSKKTTLGACTYKRKNNKINL